MSPPVEELGLKNEEYLLLQTGLKMRREENKEETLLKLKNELKFHQKLGGELDTLLKEHRHREKEIGDKTRNDISVTNLEALINKHSELVNDDILNFYLKPGYTGLIKNANMSIQDKYLTRNNETSVNKPINDTYEHFENMGIEDKRFSRNDKIYQKVNTLKKNNYKNENVFSLSAKQNINENRRIASGIKELQQSDQRLFEILYKTINNLMKKENLCIPACIEMILSWYHLSNRLCKNMEKQKVLVPSEKSRKPDISRGWCSKIEADLSSYYNICISDRDKWTSNIDSEEKTEMQKKKNLPKFLRTLNDTTSAQCILDINNYDTYFGGNNLFEIEYLSRDDFHQHLNDQEMIPLIILIREIIANKVDQETLLKDILLTLLSSPDNVEDNNNNTNKNLLEALSADSTKKNLKSRFLKDSLLGKDHLFSEEYQREFNTVLQVKRKNKSKDTITKNDDQNNLYQNKNLAVLRTRVFVTNYGKRSLIYFAIIPLTNMYPSPVPVEERHNSITSNEESESKTNISNHFMDKVIADSNITYLTELKKPIELVKFTDEDIPEKINGNNNSNVYSNVFCEVNDFPDHKDAEKNRIPPNFISSAIGFLPFADNQFLSSERKLPETNLNINNQWNQYFNNSLIAQGQDLDGNSNGRGKDNNNNTNYMYGSRKDIGIGHDFNISRQQTASTSSVSTFIPKDTLLYPYPKKRGRPKKDRNLADKWGTNASLNSFDTATSKQPIINAKKQAVFPIFSQNMLDKHCVNQIDMEEKMPTAGNAVEVSAMTAQIPEDKSWLDFLTSLNWESGNPKKESFSIDTIDPSTNPFCLNNSCETFNTDFLNSDLNQNSENYNMMNRMTKNNLTPEDNTNIINDFLMQNLLELSGNVQMKTNTREQPFTETNTGKPRRKRKSPS